MALIGSIYTIRHFDPNTPIKIVLAILTSLPIGGTILVFLKYIKRIDEFLRAQVTEVFITATGVTFFIATLWGFLENYTAITNIDFYLIYPIFWACFGLVQGIKKVRENATDS